jgi:protein SCO1/2
MNRFSQSEKSHSIARALLATKTILLLISCAFPSFAWQSEQAGQPLRANERNEAGISKSEIPDIAVFDQDGKRTLFYSQLLKGKVVAINFVYTTCSAFCTMQGANFSELQAVLGDKLGKSVNLITITTDPETDTPERLKTWSRAFKAKPGWTMITGEKKSIDEILKALTGDIGRKGMHSPIVLIGNVDKGVWIREYGLAEPERLAEMIQRMITENQ